MQSGRSAGPPAGSDDAAGSPLGAIPPGTTLLVSGPPLVGKYDLVLDVLGRGHSVGEASVVVSTRGDERTVVDDYERITPGFDRSKVGVVECVSDRDADGTERTAEGLRVRRAGSPADLTGIGIGASELVQEFDRAGAGGVRLGMDSLATTFVYTDFERVCRFLHVLSGRIVQARGVGLFVVDPSTLSDAQYDQLKTLFDGVIELREDETGPDRELRVRGVPGVDREWHEYAPMG